MAKQRFLVITDGDGEARRLLLRNSSIVKYEAHFNTAWGSRANTDAYRMAYWLVHKRWPTAAELDAWVDTVDIEPVEEDVPDSEPDPTDPAPALS